MVANAYWREHQAMDAIRMETEIGFVECPRQGDLHVEYCMGCPRRISVDQAEGRTIVVCKPGDDRVGPLWEPLRTPPAPFRLYDD
jgi:hypothetical protein